MKLLAKLALAGSLTLGSMTVVSVNTNMQTVQAAKKDQGVTMKSLMKHPRKKYCVDTINWNPYEKMYRNGKIISKELPNNKYNNVGMGDSLTSITKRNGIFFEQLDDTSTLMSDSNAPTIYTAKANVPVMAYRVTKTWDDGSGLVGIKDGKWHKTPINAGYISKGETRALLSKKKYTFNGTKYYMIYSDGYTTTDKLASQTDIGSSRIEYIKVSDFNKFKKGGKIQVASDGSYLTNYAYHFYPEDRHDGGSNGFFCPNRKVFYDLKH